MQKPHRPQHPVASEHNTLINRPCCSSPGKLPPLPAHSLTQLPLPLPHPLLQLRASANFLDRCHPLKHVASEHKSRLQQAIAEMLTAVVAPLAEEGDPRWA